MKRLLLLFVSINFYLLSDERSLLITSLIKDPLFSHVEVVTEVDSYLLELSKREDIEDSFHVMNLSRVVDRYLLWKHYLPNIIPYFAVKVNNDPFLLRTLDKLGINFDCASENEIRCILDLGISHDRIVFAHPRKSNIGLKIAKKNSIKLMTFDSIEELNKIVRIYPEAELLLRIKTDDDHSLNALSKKFGASETECLIILDEAFSLNANVVGVAFHVGSNCSDIHSYEKAIKDASILFNYCESKWNKKLSILDLGGGWPGLDEEFFVKIAKRVTELTSDLFDESVELIAEPGRFFCTPVTKACLRIIGKNIDLSQEKKRIAYFLSNGVYGFFISSIYYGYDLNKILCENWSFRPLVTKSEWDCDSDLYSSLLWGPTCDAGDKILDAIELPEMNSNDFLVVENIGAYSNVLQTKFNDITPSKPYYVFEK